MVVIIDDRADVWEWSPNLLKVIPCKSPSSSYSKEILNLGADDFFIGIGDINSSFLPKVDPLTPTLPSTPLSAKTATSKNRATNPSNSSGFTKPAAVDTSPRIPSSPVEEEIAELQTTAMLTRNNAALDAQLEERPLAKKEKELQEHEIQELHQAERLEAIPNVKEPSPKPEKHHKKALLKNDDYELIRIGKVRVLKHVGDLGLVSCIPSAIKRGPLTVF
jgi:RNA polymerase II subunit A-like phosphatase